MGKSVIPGDLFLIRPTAGRKFTIFAKNCHRVPNEVQEVVYVKGETRQNSLKCTYIEVDSAGRQVNSVLLSKPGWSWGADVGANDKKVVVANFAVNSRYNDGDADASVKRLTGADLVRLGLERGDTAEGCVDAVGSLLDKYGQGGSWIEDSEAYYHSNFIIVDPNEAWLVETCGKFWAAQKVKSDYKYFTNCYVIDTDIDKMSEGLAEKAKSLSLWNGEGEFSFCKSFGVDDDCDATKGNRLIENLIDKEKINSSEVFDILRNKELNVCRTVDDEYPTQASFASYLSSETTPCLHWFTATPDPSRSVFKPFFFSPNVKISNHTVSGVDDPKRLHQLYALHSKQNWTETNVWSLLKQMEDECVGELTDYLENYDDEGSIKLEELDELMKDCVETEIKFYR